MQWLADLTVWLNGSGAAGAALIQAAGTVVGATLAAIGGVWTFSLGRRREQQKLAEEQKQVQARLDREKAEQINDFVRALHAEILTGIVLYADQENAEDVARVLTDPSPFATADETDFVFDSIVDDITILPSDVIHHVVAYYRAAKQTNLMIRDFRDPQFLAQSADEKRLFVAGYLSLVFVLRRRGELAVAALNAYAARNGFDLSANETAVRAATASALHDAAAVIDQALAERLSDGGTDGAGA